MILKSDRLSELLRKSHDGELTDPFVITPSPSLDLLADSGAASVDLRLGTWFTSLKQARTPYLAIQRQPASSQLTKTHFVPFDREYILHPRNFVLAATLEWIRLPMNLAAYVVGKSSWGRCGLIIATATGVHPGFKGCLTLELTNVGEIPIEIKPGIAICQLFVHTVDAAGTAAADRSAFVGLRRPVFRRVEIDSFAQELSGGSTGPSPYAP